MKIGEKEAQRRRLREMAAELADGKVAVGPTTIRTATAVFVERGEKFDRVAYQREYMRKRRATQKT